VRALDQRLRVCRLEGRERHLEAHRQPERAALQGAERDVGDDLGIGGVGLGRAGDQLEGGVEAGGVPRGEELFGVGRAARSAELAGVRTSAASSPSSEAMWPSRPLPEATAEVV
jgi:hypothetical protein